jgi:ubiquinone/menaquinone biosynthesis C-methylase UbiE
VADPAPPDPSEEMEATFDRLAAVYDESRGELDGVTMDALGSVLTGAHVRSLLEIGVGTGRMAEPLTARGFEITGVDLSWGMLRNARAKGLDRLVRGTAYRLPFPSQSFDGTLFAHVLHLLDRPEAALAEAKRVGRGPVRALVTLRVDAGDPSEPLPTSDDLRKELHRILRRDGRPISPLTPPWQTERALLLRSPPDGVVPVSDRTVREPAERQIRRFEQRAYRNLQQIPDEALASAIRQLRDRFGGVQTSTRRVYGLASWSRSPIGTASFPQRRASEGASPPRDGGP